MTIDSIATFNEVTKSSLLDFSVSGQPLVTHTYNYALSLITAPPLPGPVLMSLDEYRLQITKFRRWIASADAVFGPPLNPGTSPASFMYECERKANPPIIDYNFKVGNDKVIDARFTYTNPAASQVQIKRNVALSMNRKVFDDWLSAHDAFIARIADWIFGR